MAENDNDRPGLGTLGRRLAKTALGALENRGELLMVEWQQEKERLLELLICAFGLMFLGMMGLLLLSATIIFLFAEQYRLFVAGGFTVLYLGGAGFLFFSLKSLLKREPFEETLGQFKKDRALLDAFESIHSRRKKGPWSRKAKSIGKRSNWSFKICGSMESERSAN